MKSMTGFAFEEGQFEGYSFTMDLKSYNNRYLDLILNLPNVLNSKEQEIRDWLGARIPRGRIEFTIRIKESKVPVSIKADTKVASEVVAALKELQNSQGIKGSITLKHLLHFSDVFQIEKGEGSSALWENLVPYRERLMEAFLKARETEGLRLTKDISKQVETIRSGFQGIKSKTREMESVFKENLLKKFEELKADFDENRVLTEVAMMLNRYGINEEIVRLESHLMTFQTWMESSESVGKKLDFLCQEIGREINTIGSKTTFSEVQHSVVIMKDALENIREQLRNVE